MINNDNNMMIKKYDDNNDYWSHTSKHSIKIITLIYQGKVDMKDNTQSEGKLFETNGLNTVICGQLIRIRLINWMTASTEVKVKLIENQK